VDGPLLVFLLDLGCVEGPGVMEPRDVHQLVGEDVKQQVPEGNVRMPAQVEEDVAVEEHDGVAGVGFGATAGRRPLGVLLDFAEHVGRPRRESVGEVAGGHERVAVVEPLAG